MKSGLVSALLLEQSRLSAVEEFALRHARSDVPGSRYRELMPVSPLQSGEQYAFEVNLDKCSGCKSCVTACHALNGLDEDEAWREVGLLVSDDWQRPFQQFVTSACHHCIDPACLNGCPVLAYEKDPVTGIVRHLDDQCIGCQYCVLKCPYDVPKYSAARGIVRKCDMCSQRLAAAEAPACVQACPNEAIRITSVHQNHLRSQWRQPIAELGQANTFLPASPDPSITLPTTRFVSKKRLPEDLVPGDATQVRLQPAHWPLVFMLVLTQFGAGAFFYLPWLDPTARGWLALALLGWTATWAGLAASLLHLGRPLKAWRSFLGLRKSWLSREIVAFGLFALCGSITVLVLWAGHGAGHVYRTGLLWSTATLGLVSVFCSAMIYHDTRRVFWTGARSFGRFFGTTALLGAASAWIAVALEDGSTGQIQAMLGLVSVLKFGGEHALLQRRQILAGELARAPGSDSAEFNSWSLGQSAALMRDALGIATRLRFFFLGMGGILLPSLGFMDAGNDFWFALAACTLCVVGELTERYLFFRAVVPPKMPGTR